MTITLRTTYAVLATVFLVTGGKVLPAQDTARVAARPQHSQVCWRGKQLPDCQLFVITEVGFHYRIIRPSSLISFPGGNGMVPYTQKREAATKYVAADLGVMRNAGQRSAVGMTLGFAASSFNVGSPGDGLDGSFGVKARYRRWLNANGTSVEVAAGIESRADRFDTSRRRSAGFTSDVAMNANDHIALVLRYEQLRFEGRNKPALSLGVRPGAQAGFFTAAAIAVTGLLAAVIVDSTW